MEETKIHIAKWRKAVWNVYIWCDSSYISFWKRLNYRDRTASQVALVVVPRQETETQIWSLGWEDPLEKEMATHSSILAWRIPGKTEKPGRLQSIGSQRIGQDGSDLALLETRWSVVAIGLGDGRETWICKVQWSYRAVKLSRLL